ncbi:hypothetical protein HLH36_12520 [Gluconacetobacter aggeris]|uniref:Uncharacterized protein n=1 Tax=Gluconacetobacter aggeris TaxID=1286186 RepID=A0A7W4NX28_9PROT|nr:DUF6615 family protein [Gluconacetobacter aggeris]MBB2169169.1 hypothetical protein [Gluconacetobacter aggeris]
MFLCHLVKEISRRVSFDLDDEDDMNSSYTEWYLTERFISDIRYYGHKSSGLGHILPLIKIDRPSEKTTGGDMEWVFVAPCEIQGPQYIRVIIQCKRVFLAAPVRAPRWEYSELYHSKGTGSQVVTLTNYARRSPQTAALYMLFNAGKLSGIYGSDVKGINLLNAEYVRRWRDIAIRKKSGGIWPIEVSHLKPYFFSLEDIFCPKIRIPTLLPNPRKSLEVRTNLAIHPARIITLLNSSENIRAIEVEQNQNIPDSISKSLKGYLEKEPGVYQSINKHIKRTRIVFCSNIRNFNEYDV